MENTDKHRKIRDKPKDGEGRRTQQTGTEMGYPARPGQEQYGWEEPRVVADTKLSGHTQHRVNSGMGRNRKQDKESKNLEGKTQSKLGGTIDGPKSGVEPIANRVDRLRLLGNGVVPDTCERAIRILLEEIHE